MIMEAIIKTAIATKILTDEREQLFHQRVDTDRYFTSEALGMLETGYYERLKVGAYTYSLTVNRESGMAVVTRTA